MRNAAADPITAAMKTQTTPHTTPKIAPAASVSSTAGTSATTAVAYPTMNTTGPHGPSESTHAAKLGSSPPSCRPVKTRAPTATSASTRRTHDALGLPRSGTSAAPASPARWSLAFGIALRGGGYLYPTAAHED